MRAGNLKTNIYEYVEPVQGKPRYFYFVAPSPAEIPNLPDPAKATLFKEGLEIGNDDKFDPAYPWVCRVKKDPRIPETMYRAASITTTQKFYESPLPPDIQILTPLYPFWNEIFRGQMRNIVTVDGIFRQKDIQSQLFEHTYVVREVAFQ